MTPRSSESPAPAAGAPVPATPDMPPYPAAGYGPVYYGGHWTGDDQAGIFGSLHPRRLLLVMRKKWLTILLALGFAGSAAAYYLHTTEKVYRASSLVELSVRRPRIMTQQGAVIEDQATAVQSEEIFNTRLEKLKGRRMAAGAAQRLRDAYPHAKAHVSEGDTQEPSSDVPSPAEARPVNSNVTAEVNAAADRPAEDALAGVYSRNLTLTLLRRTRLVRIQFDDADPLFAAAACNAFTEAAEACALDENRVTSDAAVVWLEAQAATQRKELLKADDLLIKFRQENKLDAMESQRKTLEDALLEFNKALVDVEGMEAREQKLLETFDGIELRPENVGKLPAAIPRSEEIRAALQKWSSATAERDGLLARYTPKHPEVQARDQMVDLYRRQALDALTQARNTAASNLELYRKQAESLRQKKTEQAKAVADLEFQIVERRTRLSALERERDASDQTYRGILNRIQEARLAADENTATLKIVERASVPTDPVKPKPVRILLLALFLGLMAGVGLALVTETLEDRVMGPEDVEASLGVRTLAVIPHAESRDRLGIATATIGDRFSLVSEAYAGLRAMLDSPRYASCSKVILIASSAPAEGKTVTTCNLATAWAKKGRKVLVIDFDLRRPRLAGIFPMPPGQEGLLDRLSHEGGGTDYRSLVYPASCPNLFVIASRYTDKAHPADVVGTPAVGKLIAWARDAYDHVIIDAPPLGPVSDALALAVHADITLVMVRQEASRKRLIQHTLRRFEDAGIRAMATVMTDVNYKKTAYGYSSPYYHYREHYKAYDMAGRKEPA